MKRQNDLEEALRKEFYSNPKIKALNDRERRCMRMMDYIGAAKIRSNIKMMWEDVKKEYANSMGGEIKQMSFSEADVPDKDMPLINELLVTIFMASDIIDSAIIDIDDILHKTDKELSFGMFDDYGKLAKNIRDKLDFFNMNTSYNKDLFWAEKSDDMYRLIRNKARAIMRKRQEKGWGDNFVIPDIGKS